MPLVNYHSVLTLKSILSSELLPFGFFLKETLTLLRDNIANLKMIRNCYHTVPSAIWEIFSEFLIFCDNSKITEKMRNEENICQYCTRQRAITTLSLNACVNKMYQELSYLLIVSGLLNII